MMDEKLMERNALKCGKCKNQWLQEVHVSRYNGAQTTVPGQKLTNMTNTFVLYKCPVCGDFNLPNVSIVGRDSIAKQYESMVDSLEKGMKEIESNKE